MSYINIVNIIMTIIGVILSIFPLQYAIIFIFGIFAKRKKYPVAVEKLKYGIVIAARNEDKVIGNLIQSIYKSDYPQEKIDIFVIAHNCTDKTAEIARKNGAVVYEYNNEHEKTKGYALRHIFRCIEKDYGIKNYDGFHVFDADNILDKNYLNKMNDAFIANNKEYAITSFRNSKNFGTNVLTACYGILYVAGCTLESGGRNALGISSRILGSGFLVSSEMVKDGWNIVILSDDTDFTIDQVLQGKKVLYCDEAMYYDEHPTNFKAMWRQRLRWAKGTLIVCRHRLGALFKTIFGFGKYKKDDTGNKVKRLRGSSFDLICCILPIGLLGLIILFVHILLISFVPLAGGNVAEIWIGWSILFGVGAIGGYIGLVLSAIICYIKERKRIKNVSTGTKILSIFVWPFFAILLAPLQITALFTRKFVWKPITHKDASNFESFHETKN